MILMEYNAKFIATVWDHRQYVWSIYTNQHFDIYFFNKILIELSYRTNPYIKSDYKCN